MYDAEEAQRRIAHQLTLMNQRRRPKQEEAKPVNESRERRKQAIARGETTYLGNPCHRGHKGVRMVKNGECYECRYVHERKRQKTRAQQRTDKRNQTKSTESSLRDLK